MTKKKNRGAIELWTSIIKMKERKNIDAVTDIFTL